MAIHELYVGGGATQNANRAMLPSPTYSAGDATLNKLKASGHKGPNIYALTRVLDFGLDTALKDYDRRVPIADEDDICIVIVPKKCLVLGYHVDVQVAQAGLTFELTATDRAGNVSVAQAVNGAVVASAFYDASMADIAPLATIDSAPIALNPMYTTQPVAIQLKVKTIGASRFGTFRIEVTPVVIDFNGGEW